MGTRMEASVRLFYNPGHTGGRQMMVDPVTFGDSGS
jgi:hypothetical protein